MLFPLPLRNVPKTRFVLFLLVAAPILWTTMLVVGEYKKLGLPPFEEKSVISRPQGFVIDKEASTSGVTSSVSGQKKAATPLPKIASPKLSLKPSPSPSFRPCTQADWNSCPKPHNASEADAYRACIKPKCDSTYTFQEINATETQELPPDIQKAFDSGEGTEIQ